MSDEVRAAYDAPFPDDSYCAGPRAMPGLVPTTPDDPASAANRAAWATLSGSGTPIFAREMRGAAGIDHPTIREAGHFLQEDAGEDLARAVVEFCRRRSC